MPTTTFSFDDETASLMSELQREYRAASKAELMRKAIALLELVRRAREKHQNLALTDDSGKVVRRIEFL